MTINIENLKALASNASAKGWSIGTFGQLGIQGPKYMLCDNDAAHNAAANPATILTLIERLERAEARVKELEAVGEPVAVCCNCFGRGDIDIAHGVTRPCDRCEGKGTIYTHAQPLQLERLAAPVVRQALPLYMAFGLCKALVVAQQPATPPAPASGSIASQTGAVQADALYAARVNERERFEQTMRTVFGEDENFDRDEIGRYVNRSWQDAYVGWIRRAAIDAAMAGSKG